MVGELAVSVRYRTDVRVWTLGTMPTPANLGKVFAIICIYIASTTALRAKHSPQNPQKR
jgi:hypothetical protein